MSDKTADMLAAAKDAAKEFVETLFTNGAGSKATRLMLVVDDANGTGCADLGGWSRAAIIDRVNDFTLSVTAKQAQQIEDLTREVERCRIVVMQANACLSPSAGQEEITTATQILNEAEEDLSRRTAKKGVNRLAVTRGPLRIDLIAGKVVG